MKYILGILMILGIAGCATMSWNYAYPYCKVNPEKFYKHLPNDYEDCLNQFDTLLSKEVISHFKNQDSTIAAIEISKEIGGLFTNFWNLCYNRDDYFKFGVYSKRMYHKPLVIDKFLDDSINDPEEMVRILFSCYYKKLNNEKYNWKTEIQRINSYWIPAKYGEGWVCPKMQKRENNIIAAYHFKQLKINDTVYILYNRSPQLISRTPDWYYLTGIIQFKQLQDTTINVKLIDIKSEFGKKYMLTGNDTIAIGDTMTEYSEGWLKRGIYYFNYGHGLNPLN